MSNKPLLIVSLGAVAAIALLLWRFPPSASRATKPVGREPVAQRPAPMPAGGQEIRLGGTAPHTENPIDAGRTPDASQPSRSREDSETAVTNESGLLKLIDQFGYTNTDRNNSLTRLFELSDSGYSTPTPEADKLIQLWNAKEYERIRQVARERLKRDPDDLPGLLLTVELAGLALNLDEYDRYARKTLTCAHAAEGEHFGELRPTLVYQLANPAPGLTGLTPEALNALQERARAEMANKTSRGRELSVEWYLRALELDGAW